MIGGAIVGTSGVDTTTVGSGLVGSVVAVASSALTWRV
jgi:hypothetical protein